MMLKEICEIVRDAETNYIHGNTKIGDYVNFQMHDTIEKIDAYLNSQHTTGDKDSLGRDKPFFNIVTAAVNIWYRATDIDRKDIKFIPTSASSVVLAFVANVFLQNWMDKNRFGQFLNNWGRSLSRYGSSVVKFVEKDGDLIPSVIPWNRLIVDPVDFEALPRIEKFYKTPAQLRMMQEYDQDMVNSLIESINTRKTLSGNQQDNQNEFIELYEVHGELDSRLLEKDPDRMMEDKEIKYVQQMHVVSFVKNEKDGYDDFTLYKGKEARDPYMITHLIEEDGRTLSIGAVEALFDAQWMSNHTAKNMKDTLDIASRLIFQTADTRYAGRNVLSAIESGDIFVHAINMPLTRVANDKPDISALQNYGLMWQNLAQQLTNTPDLTRGVTQAQPITYGLGQILNTNSNSLFEIMTENKGLSLEDMLRIHGIPNLKKKLKHKDEVVGILDDAGIQEIDSIFVPKAAIKNFNDRTKKDILAGNFDKVVPFDPAADQAPLQQELSKQGNKRFFTPDEIGSDQWDKVFSDFEWNNIRVEVTNENVDKQAVMQTLSTVLQTLASNPMLLQDPNAKMVFNQILQETGRISPIQLSVPSPMPAIPSGGPVPAGKVGAGLSPNA